MESRLNDSTMTENTDVVASGAIGSQLVSQLVAEGHEVVGTTHSGAKTGALRAHGAEPVIVDALDPDSVADVVAKGEPNPPVDAEDGVAALRRLQHGVTP